jgi:hypothetical protein
MDWCTVRGAAARLKVHDTTVRRMIREGRIKAYMPYAAPDEDGPKLLYCHDVDQLAAARRRVKGQHADTAPKSTQEASR